MSARPNGCAPGCSPTSEPGTRTTRRRGSSTRRSEIRWDYVPSEFAAYLGELRQIRKFRPYFNHKGNRTRRSVLIKIAGGPAPRVYGGGTLAREDMRCYGPFQSMARMLEAVRTLNDLLGLRDCPTAMPVVIRRPGRSLRAATAGRPACDTSWGSAPGPAPAWCPNASTSDGSTPRWPFWRAVPSSRSIGLFRPCSRPSANAQFEIAARWREKFEQLEWLLAATSRARSAIDLLTFVYRDPGDFGDDRVYLLRRGVVRGVVPLSCHSDRA